MLPGCNLYGSEKTTRTGVQLTTMLNHALMPELSRAEGSRDTALRSMVVAATLVGSIAVLIPFACLMLAGGPFLLNIWSRGVIHAPYSLLVLMTIVMLIKNGLWHPQSNLLLAINAHSTYFFTFTLRLHGGCHRSHTANE